MSDFLRSPLLIFPAVALMGCSIQLGADEESTETPVQAYTQPPAATPTPTPTLAPTPTVVPTPVPTPTPVPPNGFRVSRWAMTDDAGLDLDGDGSVDNELIPIYDSSVLVIAEVVFGASYEAMVDQGIPIEQARLLALQLRDSVLFYYSVDNFNNLSALSIAGDRFNLVPEMGDSSGTYALSFFEADVTEEGFYSTGDEIGRFNRVQAGNNPLFGTGELWIDFTPIFAGDEEEILTLSGIPVMPLSDVWVSLAQEGDGIEDGQVSGVVWRADMLTYMTALIPSSICVRNLAIDCLPLSIEEMVVEQLDALYDQLEGEGKWSVQGSGTVGVTAGFAWDAAPAVLTD